MSEVNAVRFIYLDTNVLSKLNGDTFGAKILEYIEQTINLNKGWGTAISTITELEILNELPVEQEKKLKEKILNLFPRFQIEQNIIEMASLLGCLYATYYKETKIDDKHPELPDKIIAATAFVHKGAILTENMRDFPAPFFREIGSQTFTSEKKKVQNITLYIMLPQEEEFESYKAKRYC